MTPDPKGYPRTSPMHSCVPSQPLTDKRIELRAIEGWYGSKLQAYYKAIERGKQLLNKQKSLTKQKIQQQINDLLT